MKVLETTIESEGTEISGSLCYPDETQISYPFMVILHGIPSPEGRKLSVQEKGYLDICTPYCNYGFIIALFNFQGCKGSAGSYSPLGWVQNVRSIIDHVQNHEPKVNSKKMGILAFSAGAMIAPYFVAHDSRPKFLVCAAPPADLHASSSFLNRLTLGILVTFEKQKLNTKVIRQELLEINPLLHINKVHVPLLIMHGDKDPIIPTQNSITLYEAANEPKELRIIPEGGHKLHRDPQALKEIFDWVIHQLE